MLDFESLGFMSLIPVAATRLRHGTVMLLVMMKMMVTMKGSGAVWREWGGLMSDHNNHRHHYWWSWSWLEFKFEGVNRTVCSSVRSEPLPSPGCAARQHARIPEQSRSCSARGEMTARRRNASEPLKEVCGGAAEEERQSSAHFLTNSGSFCRQEPDTRPASSLSPLPGIHAVGAAAGTGVPVGGAADDSSDSEAEQEGAQKLIRKVSTSGQIRSKVLTPNGPSAADLSVFFPCVLQTFVCVYNSSLWVCVSLGL